MDARRRAADRAAESEPLARAVAGAGLLVSLTLVALTTLVPEGTGWRWGSPAAELGWYLHGLGSPDTVLQRTAGRRPAAPSRAPVPAPRPVRT